MTPSPRRHVAHAILAVVLALSSTARAIEAAPPGLSGLSDLSGLWERTDRAADDVQRNEEIKRITASMSLLVRGIARAVMAHAMAPPERYAIRVADPGLAIRADDDDEQLMHLNGEPEADVMATARSVEGGFEQPWQHGERSRGTTLWRLSADATRLTVTSSVQDTRFDGKLVYSTTYRRLPVAETSMIGISQ